MSVLELPKELCSIDQSKFCSNSSTDEKFNDAAGGKVDDVAARKAVTHVTEGAETKKYWCQLLSKFPQGPIWWKVYEGFFHTKDFNTNSRSLVKREITPSTASLNPTVEISEPRFMAGAGKDLPEHAMICLIRREEGISVKEAEAEPMKEACSAHITSLAEASNVFRTGSGVKYIGSASGALHLSPIWGLKVGSTGRVALSFNDNPFAKVGVRFDNPFIYGVDLGGFCDDSHGYFCKVNELCLDAPAVDALDKILTNTLFEVVFNESRKSPFILFVKDADKVMAGNSELYSTFRSRLEKLPDNVVIIGSYAHTDNHKEKVQRRLLDGHWAIT